MKYLRLLLFPFSLIYGLIVVIRNFFYDAGLFKSRQFDLPVIAVGNLEVGGAGKSPMTEYLIRLLKNDFKLATLSRGYGRETKGYQTATATATATTIGDEPAQFKHKFPDITVAVCEKRVDGIEQLKNDHDLIILDDAYQHRAVKPGLSVLLFDYNKLDDLHLVLPAGNYREPFFGKWRAGIIIISKCPADLSQDQLEKIVNDIAPQPYQQMFFTTINYLGLQDMAGNANETTIDTDTTVFLLTGIANAQPLVNHIKKQTLHVIHHNYPDHHRFSLKNITKLADEFAACASQKKVIITTEKDAQRLGEQELLPLVKQLPVLVLPIGISFLRHGQEFNEIVTEYVRKYREHHPIH
ncbi:tetraacyldisaccharide 4'-kinase [Mucilaginibacter sp. UR6-11]|uniref:tetraacyldisaccharide 4'-kinase n=1 Tax=Mucilaginibacter sp. UR6-11 TaxID=1435644 RepID=UPI001E534101|nr:tetraacyldisaccharide 4'-kinase [Mucilaginibacter sp. UR6-11]MCC8425679.1 tetraacyldisaccharide 4'-kinase [Mucilaginibacter sp. UR6-11]